MGRTFFRSARATLGEGLERWLAAFGQCPSPERDAGLCAWQHLRRGSGGGGPPLLGGPMVDDPHLSVGTSL